MSEVKPLSKQHEKLFAMLDKAVSALNLRGQTDAAITLYPSQWSLLATVLDGKHHAPRGLDVTNCAYRGHPLKRMQT